MFIVAELCFIYVLYVGLHYLVEESNWQLFFHVCCTLCGVACLLHQYIVQLSSSSWVLSCQTLM